MDIDTTIKIIAALGGPATIVALYRWSVAQGKKEALAEQVSKTIEAKDTEIAELKIEIKQRDEWLDALTRPQGRSQ